jgi:hypothetical protein
MTISSKIQEYGNNIEQIHLIKHGHIEIFQYGEDLPNDEDYKLFAIYLKNGKVIR